jgi:hypothetical protein
MFDFCDQKVKAEFKALYPRYLWAGLFMPMCAFSVSLLAIVLIRKAGPCISRVATFPTGDQNVLECSDIDAVGFILLFVTAPFGTGGPFSWVVLFAPYLISYPDVSTLRKRYNQILLAISVFLAIVMTLSVALVKNDFKSGMMGFKRIVLEGFLLIVVPLIYKRLMSDRERNIFLIRMEHAWTCCEETIMFRSFSKPDFFEISLFIFVALDLIVYFVGGVFHISITPILFLGFIPVIFFCWTERSLHFYKDQVYVYLLVIYPMIMMEVYFYVFEQQQTLMINGEVELQIAVVLGCNLFLLIVSRAIRRFAMCATENKRKVVLLMFPAKFIDHVFQYLILYSMRNMFSPTFWAASVIVLITNILDTSGLLGDLHETLIQRIRSAVTRRNIEEYPMGRPVYSEALDSSFGAQSMYSGSVENVVDSTAFTLDQIYQKCYIMLFLPTLMAFWLWVDVYIDGNTLEGQSACAYSCNFPIPVRGWEFIFYRAAVIFAQYVVVVIITMLIWRLKLKELMMKYPDLARILWPKNDEERAAAMPSTSGTTGPRTRDRRKIKEERAELDLRRILRVIYFVTLTKNLGLSLRHLVQQETRCNHDMHNCLCQLYCSTPVSRHKNKIESL